MYGNADDWDVIRDSHEKSMREAMSEILAAREAERADRYYLALSKERRTIVESRVLSSSRNAHVTLAILFRGRLVDGTKGLDQVALVVEARVECDGGDCILG